MDDSQKLRWRILFLKIEKISIFAKSYDEKITITNHTKSMTPEEKLQEVEDVRAENQSFNGAVMRMEFYNICAEKFLHDNNVSEWENQTTERNIMKYCKAHKLNPPIKEWAAAFDKALDNGDIRRRQNMTNERHLNDEKKRLIGGDVSVGLEHLKFNKGLSAKQYEEFIKQEDTWSVYLIVDIFDIRYMVPIENVEYNDEILLARLEAINNLMPKYSQPNENRMIMKILDNMGCKEL